MFFSNNLRKTEEEYIFVEISDFFNKKLNHEFPFLESHQLSSPNMIHIHTYIYIYLKCLFVFIYNINIFMNLYVFMNV